MLDEEQVVAMALETAFTVHKHILDIVFLIQIES